MLPLNLHFPSNNLALIVISQFSLHYYACFEIQMSIVMFPWFFCLKIENVISMWSFVFNTTFPISHAELISYPLLHIVSVSNTSLIPSIMNYIYTWIQTMSTIIQISSFIFRFSMVGHSCFLFPSYSLHNLNFEIQMHLTPSQPNVINFGLNVLSFSMYSFWL